MRLKKEDGEMEWLDGSVAEDLPFEIVSTKNQKLHCGAVSNVQVKSNGTFIKTLTFTKCFRINARFICDKRGNCRQRDLGVNSNYFKV